MRPNRLDTPSDGFPDLRGSSSELLSLEQERSLLQDLADCKSKLVDALTGIDGLEVPSGADDPQSLANFVSTAYSSDGARGARLGAIYRKYSESRSKLALANLRLVAHVAKRFRDRGIPYSDLIQEGFCGLMEAIDRFDMSHQTKLATYATWWIRQSMQRAVASGAYPVRLSPRHLRQLAQNQDELDRNAGPDGPPAPGAGGSEMIRRIHTATRPTVSLDAAFESDGNFTLL